MAFHGICPVGPERSGCPDTLWDVKKCVDGQRASRKSCWVISVAYINWIIYNSREMKYSLFISLNPWLETLINLIQHCLIKLKCQTQLDNFDKLQEMYVILVFFEPSMQYNWSDIEHPIGVLLSVHQQLFCHNVGHWSPESCWDCCATGCCSYSNCIPDMRCNNITVVLMI